MKLNNLFIVTILTASALIAGCKTKKNKDHIVTKWHVTDVSGKGAEMIPDSTKTKMFKEATIEFKNDGKYETYGMGSGSQKGTWHFTADEKALITVEDGSSVSDTVNVVELTAGKMVVQDSKGEIKISFKAH